ncbi:hypothetical protein QYM36_014696 [Artemia franciscana]|uniref:Uncharacterized protein n=1 Tax=Artemia franciscana TaxID=6661 RepID=A0AA88HD66_ARTSF|nr:hypothetical protein QYM36_014696 [Artemia franciscana]
MVIIEKKNRTVRTCIDPVDINKCIKCPYYPIPTLEDVTAKLHGAKVFRLTLVRNPIHKARPRVQGLMLQLLPYDLQLQFWPGSEISIANALVCLHLLDIDVKLPTEIDVYDHQISRHLPVFDEKVLRIQEETAKDSQLRILAKTIHEGWPKSRKICQSEAHRFCNIQHELSRNKGIIFKGKRLVIFKILQPETTPRCSC